MKDLILGVVFLWSMTGFGQNSAIFGGGNSDGWAYASIEQSSNNIFSGGSGDGWAFGLHEQDSNNIFLGGTGDGWANGLSPLTVLSVVANDFASGFVAYPNPTSGALNIGLGQVYTSIEIEVSNVLGQTISKQGYRSVDTVALEIDGQSGTYFVRVTADGKQATIKILHK
jgi:hypothetical protein